MRVRWRRWSCVVAVRNRRCRVSLSFRNEAAFAVVNVCFRCIACVRLILYSWCSFSNAAVAASARVGKGRVILARNVFIWLKAQGLRDCAQGLREFARG